MSIRDKTAIDLGVHSATVTNALVGIERDGHEIARSPRSGFRVTYGVEVTDHRDLPL